MLPTDVKKVLNFWRKSRKKLQIKLITRATLGFENTRIRPHEVLCLESLKCRRSL